MELFQKGSANLINDKAPLQLSGRGTNSLFHKNGKSTSNNAIFT